LWRAAWGVPSIVPSTVFGDTAPSNRVNVGQIGCGSISHYHWGHMAGMPDVQIVAVSDAYKSRRDGWAARANAHYGTESGVTAHAAGGPDSLLSGCRQAQEAVHAIQRIGTPAMSRYSSD